MRQIPDLASLVAQRRFFESGATLSYNFRKQQLQALSEALKHFEEPLFDALYSDLKKSREEAWVTEIGFVQAEIRVAIRELKRWMQPRRVSTNLVNLPSSSRIMPEPLGVVFIIGPWNYPFQLCMVPLVAAIAAGNCVVLKTGEAATATDEVLQRLIESCFSPELVQYVRGPGVDVVPAIMQSFRFDHIFFTGGPGAGRAIYRMAADQLIPVTLELGGKSPCIVAADANLPVAARRIASTKFSNAGQMCVAPDYILVHSSEKEELIAELKKCIQQFFGEDPASSYNYGKIINTQQFDRLVNYLKDGNIVAGGNNNRESLYIEPTLLTDLSWDSPVMQNEIFGPILPILSFDSEEDWKAAIARHPNPLSAYIFTNSKQTQTRWMRELHFGGGCINNASWHLTNPALPFGGRGASGFGSYHGQYGFDRFSHMKSILKTPVWPDLRIKYPPLKGRLSLFRKFIG